MRRRLYAIALAMGIGAALYTFAGDSVPASAQVATTVDIQLNDLRFSPDTIDVPAGTVTFNLSNTDRTRHDFVVMVDGEEVASDIMGPGKSGPFDVLLAQPGTYEFFCGISDHREKGMVGTINVR